MSVNKNGNLIVNSSVISKMNVKQLSDGSKWARIYFLDVSNTKTFFTKDEVLDCTNQNNKFSRMGMVDTFKSSDGYYEFMLTYPSLSTTLYNRWKQASSPNESTVTDFIKITMAWTNHCAGIRKHGSAAIYDCDTGGTWYAPICQLAAWNSSTSLYIPAADGSNQTQCELWVRYDNIPSINNGMCECNAMSIFCDSNGIPLVNTITYTPTTSQNSCMTQRTIDVELNVKYCIECTLTWSDFDKSNTNGTFDMWFQGSQNEGVWTYSNPMTTALNKIKRPKDVVLSSSSGSYRYKTFFINTNPEIKRLGLSIRTDYSNGQGTVSISDVVIVPERYYVSDKIKARFSEDFVSCNEIIEL